MAESDRIPGVVAPPPLVFGGCLLAGLVLDELAGAPGIAIAWPLRWLFGLGALGAAFWLVREAWRAFRAAGTPVEPWRPTSALVTTGIFRRSRNPIYIGMALAQLGIGLLLDSVFAVVALVPALLVIRYGVIEREESFLAEKFGQPYRVYLAQVRRWV